MTAEESYRQLLAEAGIEPEQTGGRLIDGRRDVTVSMLKSRDELGYSQYYVRHVFNLDGSLHRIEVFY